MTEEFRVRWKLVAIVDRTHLGGNYEELVPENERYTAEQKDRIASHPYWYKGDGLYFLDDGPVLGRQIGQVVEGDDLWPESIPDEPNIGIYKLLFEKVE
ncbi:MAG: hypothetical protein A2787_06690 [Omnitrophica WOR_2 bacterium RIFCSPHIGHO2_01_FULL_48_9]|nr:MAG: hypothetical protein A2787_06690 [Omnitrophica WOR_2 bacterium RIFCSPHIGHO2_01_FULL_48_9]